MKRRIIKIDQKKCNGCGLCAQACHEDAIGMVEGKATLLRDDYCDGLGDCLPACPVDAISFEEREAAPYDKEAVEQRQLQKKVIQQGCPGSQQQTLSPKNSTLEETSPSSQLNQWPVQIKLAPIHADYFKNASLLIAADCTAYAYGNFHNQFIHNHVTLIGCPKLDEGDYTEKLTEIIKNNEIKDVTIVRMEVPCCGGIAQTAKNALQNSGKFIPWQIVTISVDGKILD